MFISLKASSLPRYLGRYLQPVRRCSHGSVASRGTTQQNLSYQTPEATSPTMAPKNLRNTYTPPSSPHLKPIIICGIVMTLAAAPTPAILHPGNLNSPLPENVATAGRWIQAGLFYFLYGAHAVETLMFMKRLQEHGVGFLSAAWLKWVATCFVGGKFCFEHFDRLVGKKA